jgi:hypothetical protein
MIPFVQQPKLTLRHLHHSPLRRAPCSIQEPAHSAPTPADGRDERARRARNRDFGTVYVCLPPFRPPSVVRKRAVRPCHVERTSLLGFGLGCRMLDGDCVERWIPPRTFVDLPICQGTRGRGIMGERVMRCSTPPARVIDTPPVIVVCDCTITLCCGCNFRVGSGVRSGVKRRCVRRCIRRCVSQVDKKAQ